MPDVAYHGETHRPRTKGGSDPAFSLGYYEIKVFADRDALDGNLPDTAIIVSTGDAKFVFAIPADLDGCELHQCAAFVSVAGAVTVQIRNITQTYDFLSTPITIAGGDFTSYEGTPPVITDDLVVDKGDRIAIDVDAADGTAEGLGVILQFTGR